MIIKIQGGLGNQMFQYALYLKLRAMGKEVKMDEKTLRSEEKFNIFIWEPKK